MVDYFALLEQPRRPWLDPEDLEEKYHQLARTTHPDETRSGEGAAFAEINAAYRTLRDPKLRLQHLLALEGKSPAASSEVPGDLVDLFMEVAPVIKRGDKREMETLERRLASLLDNALTQLRALDCKWGESGALDRAVALYQRFSFLTRWRDVIEERCL